jgi:hypothetical protein
VSFKKIRHKEVTVGAGITGSKEHFFLAHVLLSKSQAMQSYV